MNSSSERKDTETFFRLDGVSRSFGNVRALRNISLSFSGGERVLLLGANGSGKSTLLKLCSGIIRAESGSISSSNGSVGHFGHSLYLYGKYTVEENLKLFSDILGADSEQLEDYMQSWGIADLKHKQIAELSKGQQALSSLARAFLGNPDFLFLDEPSASLDERALEILNCKINELSEKKGKSFFSVTASHDFMRLSPCATRFIVLSEGRIKEDSPSLLEFHKNIEQKYLGTLR